MYIDNRRKTMSIVGWAAKWDTFGCALVLCALEIQVFRRVAISR